MTSPATTDGTSPEPGKWWSFILRPLAAFAIRHNLSFQDAVELLKQAYVAESAAELRKAGEAVNVSRVSASTGVHRKDVTRILSLKSPPEPRAKGLLDRVMTQWRHDKRFSTRGHHPKVLTCDGKSSEFADLIRSVSSDLDYATVLFEMERSHIVERSGDKVTLRGRAYSPKGNPDEGFLMVGGDIRDLVSSAEENIFFRPEPPNLHAKTEFDNIREDAIPEIRAWLFDEGKKLHQRARAFLAQFDLDINRTAREGAVGKARVALGTFSFTATNKDSNESPERDA